jgi:hypothetical protein
MDDEAGTSSGEAQWPKPAIPNSVVIISVAIAVLAVSALIWVLFQKTTGPGEIVHDYYEAVAAGDCDGAFSLLSPVLQQDQDRESFCSGSGTSSTVPADPRVESVTLVGPEGSAKAAAVTVDESGSGGPTVWNLARQGDTWVITAFPDTGRFAHPPRPSALEP